jgi:hypothetical protein
MLGIYVAEYCPRLPTARLWATQLRERAPEVLIEVAHVGVPGVWGRP